MIGPDVLDSGPTTPRRRRPRWLPVAGGVVAAGIAVLLAAQAAPGPGTPPPVPTPSAAPTFPALPPVVNSAAVGKRSAYVLITRCDRNAVQACQHELFGRRPGGGWAVLPLRFETRSTVGGFPTVLAGPDDRAVVLNLEQTWAYLPTGDTFARRALALGPEIDAVPPGGMLLHGSCPRCDGRLVVLDIATGRLRPLAAQPQFGTRWGASYDRLGGTIWALPEPDDRAPAAAGRDDGTAAAAVSTDHGRTWRSVRMPRTAADGTQVIVAPDGGAYLIGTRNDEAGNSRLAGIWRSRAGGWRQLRPETMPTTATSVVGGGQALLIVDAAGITWRLGPTDDFERLPDPGLARPDLVYGGSDTLLIATPRQGQPSQVVTSSDRGGSWQSERVL